MDTIMAAYRISITGERSHLTAANKRDISHMLDNGMTQGKTRAGISYALQKDDSAPDAWHVRITRNESDDWGRMKESVNRVTFTARAAVAS